MTVNLGFYKLATDVKDPYFATEGSACFDIHFWSNPSKTNNEFLTIDPGQIVQCGTGLILDIPFGYSVRLHPRSGLSYKGLNLANCEGVVDSDYVSEILILLMNNSNHQLSIENGMRIAQGELVKNIPTKLINIHEKPEQKTSRTGGFGSTGEN